MKTKGFTPLEIFEEFRIIYQNLCSVCKKPVRSFKNIPSHLRFLTGFTLLEVLIVVIIIGILASIALPQYINTLEKARSGEAVTNIGNIRASLDRYWYERGSLPTDDVFSALDTDDPNSQANKLWQYHFTDDGTDATTRKYAVTANRYKSGAEDAGTYVEWQQTDNITGKLYKSTNLGGPERPVGIL